MTLNQKPRRAFPSVSATIGSGWASIALALAACGPSESATHTIESTRDLTVAPDEIQWGATTAERFGMNRRAPSGHSGGDSPHGEPRGEASLGWDTPEGWTEQAPTAMRYANFLAGDPKVECYLTQLAGEAGGLMLNVNRWREQMSLPPATDDEIAGLPKAEFFGGAATLVDIRGTWTAMGGTESSEDYRLLGLCRVAPSGSVFLKLVGPASAVDPQYGAFLGLAKSFRLDYEDAPPAPAGPGGGGGGGAFSFDAPDSWTRVADADFRSPNFTLGEGGNTECYITVLGGDGGGGLTNANRWRRQLGDKELTGPDFEALERLPMLGSEGVLVECNGNFRGMSGQAVEDATMLGVICDLSGTTAFVKMVGPSAVVAGERTNFIAFCKSLTRN